MKRTLIGSLVTLGGMFIISAILFGIAVATPEETPLYNAMLGGVVMMLCASPVPMLVAIISGIGTLINTFNGTEKRKREFDDFSFVDSDVRMDEIMRRLSPEQQVYLENRLRNNRLGVGSDGEIVSMHDLFDNDNQENRM